MIPSSCSLFAGCLSSSFLLLTYTTTIGGSHSFDLLTYTIRTDVFVSLDGFRDTLGFSSVLRLRCIAIWYSTMETLELKLCRSIFGFGDLIQPVSLGLLYSFLLAALDPTLTSCQYRLRDMCHPTSSLASHPVSHPHLTQPLFRKFSVTRCCASWETTWHGVRDRTPRRETLGDAGCYASFRVGRARGASKRRWEGTNQFRCPRAVVP